MLTVIKCRQLYGDTSFVCIYLSQQIIKMYIFRSQHEKVAHIDIVN